MIICTQRLDFFFPQNSTKDGFGCALLLLQMKFCKNLKKLYYQIRITVHKQWCKMMSNSRHRRSCRKTACICTLYRKQTVVCTVHRLKTSATGETENVFGIISLLL